MMMLMHKYTHFLVLCICSGCLAAVASLYWLNALPQRHATANFVHNRIIFLSAIYEKLQIAHHQEDRRQQQQEQQQRILSRCLTENVGTDGLNKNI